MGTQNYCPPNATYAVCTWRFFWEEQYRVLSDFEGVIPLSSLWTIDLHLRSVVPYRGVFHRVAHPIFLTYLRENHHRAKC
jgi:hypothetical protein